jgi:hypothetical protein
VSINTKEFLLTFAVCLAGAVITGLVCRDAVAGVVAFPLIVLCALLDIAIDIRNRLAIDDEQEQEEKKPNAQ